MGEAMLLPDEQPMSRGFIENLLSKSMPHGIVVVWVEHHATSCLHRGSGGHAAEIRCPSSHPRKAVSAV
jgi:hypothetical protein